jgi:hypothetical protein
MHARHLGIDEKHALATAGLILGKLERDVESACCRRQDLDQKRRLVGGHGIVGRFSAIDTEIGHTSGRGRCHDIGVADESPAGASSDLSVNHRGQIHDNAVVTAAGAGHHDNFALYQFETLFPTGDPSQELSWVDFFGPLRAAQL